MNLDIFNRFLKYILIGVIAGIIIKYAPSNIVIEDIELYIIVMLISISYAFIDRVFPSVADKDQR